MTFIVAMSLSSRLPICEVRGTHDSRKGATARRQSLGREDELPQDDDHRRRKRKQASGKKGRPFERLLWYDVLVEPPVTIRSSRCHGAAKHQHSRRDQSLMSAAMLATEKKMVTERQLIDSGSDKRYVRRDKQGQFNEPTDVGRSFSADKHHKSQTKPNPGKRDRGDHHPKH
jgi:hypothetical protein